MAALLVLGLFAASPAGAASGPKVAVIVGPSGAHTAAYRRAADATAAVARRYTQNVVLVYSPNATWTRARAAMAGASVVVYFGIGRGYPSRYSSTLAPATEDGLGLNPAAGGNSTRVRWYGEASVRTAALAPNAIVLLYQAAYASGAGEPGSASPSLSIARRRVDDYGAGFLAAGAAAVIAQRSGDAAYYLKSIFAASMSLDAMWRAAPSRHGHVTPFTSTRTALAVGRTDPDHSSSGFYRSIVGRLWISTATVRDGHRPTPSPGVVYGPGINADDLNNSLVGGPGNRQVAYRFRATDTAALSAIRVYLVTGSGYSGGTGGRIEISVRDDDGSAAHLPSGTVLAATTYVPGTTIANSGLPRIDFASAATLEAGRLYHIVFRNVDPAPTVNYTSVDGLFTFGTLAVWQPRVSNTDWANLVWSGGAWSADRGPGQGVITPIMELVYGNGDVGGVGYMEVWSGLPKVISGSRAARESFTVQGSDRQVAAVSVRLRRLDGGGPLILRLESGAGALIDAVSVPASALPLSARPTWVSATFNSFHPLVAGQPYHLVLTASSNTHYSVYVIRKGAAFGFDPGTFFADGYAQYNAGTGWAGFDQPGGRTNLSLGDLQFYFR